MFPMCLLLFLMQINASNCNFAFWSSTGWGAVLAGQSSFVAPSAASLAHVGGGEIIGGNVGVSTDISAPQPQKEDHESQQGAAHEHQERDDDA